MTEAKAQKDPFLKLSFWFFFVCVLMDLSERQQLAAAFQIAAEIHGWDQLIYNHFTVRVRDRFLVHPFGLLFSEVCFWRVLAVCLRVNKQR
jgi:ribulose-5-phosphate 4-epimerase/fuculose-1-phosphate aldolase